MLLTAGAASLPAILFRASTMYASPLAHIPRRAAATEAGLP